jgi:broad specificity phosphatase PhoE
VTPEEMERTIQFILEQEAKFASDIRQLREVQTSASGAIVTMLDMMGRWMKETNDRFKDTDERIRRLADAQTHTNESVAEIADRVNAFITVVERYITGDGKNRPPA